MGEGAATVSTHVLDTATGREILKLIQDLHERLSSTVVIVTHDSRMEPYAHRVIHMADGRITSDERLVSKTAGAGAGA